MTTINTPQYNSITNIYKRTNDKTNCNPFNKPNNFGNYFNQCSEKSAYWGSERPSEYTCHKPHSGTPCTSLFNNLTKRKSVVEYKREPVTYYPPINIQSNPFYFIDQVPNQEKAFNYPPLNCNYNCTYSCT